MLTKHYMPNIYSCMKKEWKLSDSLVFFYLLREKETGDTIGDCGFHTWNTIHHLAEAFYSLRDDKYKNKGLMTEAFAELLKYGYTVLIFTE